MLMPLKPLHLSHSSTWATCRLYDTLFLAAHPCPSDFILPSCLSHSFFQTPFEFPEYSFWIHLPLNSPCSVAISLICVHRDFIHCVVTCVCAGLRLFSSRKCHITSRALYRVTACPTVTWEDVNTVFRGSTTGLESCPRVGSSNKFPGLAALAAWREAEGLEKHHFPKMKQSELQMSEALSCCGRGEKFQP